MASLSVVITPASASASAYASPSSLLHRSTRRTRGNRGTCCFALPAVSASSFHGKRVVSDAFRCSRVAMSAEVDSEEKKPKIVREEEKFAVLDTGLWECNSCGFVYDQSKGDPSYPIAAGLEFKQLPEDWRCPTCGAAQTVFVNKSRQVAGFAQNQSYGLGGNSLTEGQKSLLIYGSLIFFFFLFLSGYFLN